MQWDCKYVIKEWIIEKNVKSRYLGMEDGGGGGAVISSSICGNNFEIDLIKYYLAFLNFDDSELEHVNIL